MHLAVGADHAGFELKEALLELLRGAGHDVLDVGTHTSEAVDYPDFAGAVAERVATGQVERGIMVCGSGVGASIAANKIPGARAAVCHDCYSAGQGVEHDDMNVLVLGARVVGIEVARQLVLAFLAATFSGEERHRRRLTKVLELERRGVGARPATGTEGA